MTLSYSDYLTVNDPYIYLLPEYRSHLDVSLPTEVHPKFLEYCVLPADAPQFSIWAFPHHPLEMTSTTSNDPTSRNPVALNQVSAEATQMVHPYVSTDQETFQVPAANEAEMCGSAIMHEVQFSVNDQWRVCQEIGRVVFQESFVIPFCKPAWKYVAVRVNYYHRDQILMENR
jgi:hypothetical protein